MFNFYIVTIWLILSVNLLTSVDSTECSSDTGTGETLCLNDGSRRLAKDEMILENSRRLHGWRPHDDDCPLCKGKNWKCYTPFTVCGFANNEVYFANLCVCDTDSEGNAVCWQNEWCNRVDPCRSNYDCDDGYVCVSTCCGRGHCFESCDIDGGIQFDNALPEDCCELDLPASCEESWDVSCECDDPSSLCLTCNEGVGCDQCKDVGTNWKLNYGYPCTNCQSIFGEECEFCQDFHGCGKCDENECFIRVYDEKCGVWKCEDRRELYGEGCIICQESQCGQCEDGYTMVVNEDGIQVCV